MRHLLLPLLLMALFAHCSTPTDPATPPVPAHQVSYDSIDIDRAHAIWLAKSADVECYEMTVEQIAFAGSDPFRIRVEHGAIVEVAVIPPSPDPPYQLQPGAFKRFPTVDTLFDLAGSLGRQVKDSTVVTPFRLYVIEVQALYDATWGFPSEVLRHYGNSEMFCMDCSTGYKVTAFKPLDCP